MCSGPSAGRSAARSRRSGVDDRERAVGNPLRLGGSRSDISSPESRSSYDHRHPLALATSRSSRQPCCRSGSASCPLINTPAAHRKQGRERRGKPENHASRVIPQAAESAWASAPAGLLTASARVAAPLGGTAPARRNVTADQSLAILSIAARPGLFSLEVIKAAQERGTARVWRTRTRCTHGRYWPWRAGIDLADALVSQARAVSRRTGIKQSLVCTCKPAPPYTAVGRGARGGTGQHSAPAVAADTLPPPRRSDPDRGRPGVLSLRSPTSPRPGRSCGNQRAAERQARPRRPSREARALRTQLSTRPCPQRSKGVVPDHAELRVLRCSPQRLSFSKIGATCSCHRVPLSRRRCRSIGSWAPPRGAKRSRVPGTQAFLDELTRGEDPISCQSHDAHPDRWRWVVIRETLHSSRS